MSLNYYAPRTCYEFVKDGVGREIRKTEELSSYRDCPAYVLLGQPGSGKTATFKEEAKQPGCEYVSARDFITFDVKPDWRDKTLFIDGLDEVRAGRSNVLTSFDEIRKKLDQLGRPRFRLSCREADWYGEIDKKELAKVSPDGDINELFLTDLEEEDIPKVLVNNCHKTESEASSFLEEVKRRGLTDLIKNPQTLGMLVTAVSEETAWPKRKSEVFKLACEKLLLVEWNKTHAMANCDESPPVENLMHASGMLCAVMLLARKDGFALSRPDQSENYPFIADMADDDQRLLQLVAGTRLFTTRDGRTEYSHRIFAEYLSAYYLSEKVIAGGLPIGRVLALMTGTDGGVVAELRGVYGWLTTLCHNERVRLMARDPLGVVLYGDVGLFSREERLKLLHELSNHAERTGDAGIDYRKTQPFGAFCQTDMEQAYLSILESRDRGDTHQYLLTYVLASMTHGRALPGLSDALSGLLKEPDYQPRNRRQALKVLVRFNDQQALEKILKDVWQNVIPDPDDELLGQLLLSQYPGRIAPGEIFNYFRAPKRTDYIGAYDYFWSDKLTWLSKDAQVKQLLDALVTIQAKSGRGCVSGISDIKPEDSYHKQRIKRKREEQDQDKKAFVQFIRNNSREVEAGTAKPGIFSKLASAYYGYFIGSRGDNPAERLRHFFNDDIGLVQAVSNGLRRFVYREDIPDVKEILQAHVENKHSVCSHPYRAGMDELARSGMQTLLELDQDKIEKALAFHFTDGTEEVVWYKAMLQERPELVARVYTLYGKMALQAGKTHITGSYSLAFDENHRQLASVVVLPLLRSFRVRSASAQLAPLYDLLAAALQHADCKHFKGLIEKKLSRKSMDAAQRVLWLAAGFLLDTMRFKRRLTEFVSGNESRINYLIGFLSYERHQWSPLDNLTLPAPVSLVRLLGPYYAPYSDSERTTARAGEQARLLRPYDASELISRLIHQLAAITTDQATGEIERLLDTEQLAKWSPLLKTILHEQRVRKHEASFQYASLEQVRDALKNGPPANIADLACVTRDRIRELAERIKYGNTNDFRQYWEKYLEKRKHEETCRNQFLSDLRPLLEDTQADAQPEGQYVTDGRADIRVSFGGSVGYNVPIEIKCNDSKDLWYGIRKQLIERYTIDPGAYGYGIYLVFWFGFEKTTPHPKIGPKPGTPAELEERLNQLLRNDEERNKISVCVVDCTAGGQVKTL